MGPEREQHPGGDGQLAHRYCPSADEDLPSPSSLGSPLPGGTNCYVPTAVTIAIWQQPGCCTGTGAGGGGDGGAPLETQRGKGQRAEFTVASSFFLMKIILKKQKKRHIS